MALLVDVEAVAVEGAEETGDGVLDARKVIDSTLTRH